MILYFFVSFFFIIRNFYKANPRPDALMKEQIVEMSGLSPRVIRVWFQNKRCKDKKNQIKMEMQQERVSMNLNVCIICMNDIIEFICPTKKNLFILSVSIFISF